MNAHSHEGGSCEAEEAEAEAEEEEDFAAGTAWKKVVSVIDFYILCQLRPKIFYFFYLYLIESFIWMLQEVALEQEGNPA